MEAIGRTASGSAPHGALLYSRRRAISPGDAMPQRLSRHIAVTYIHLRRGMAALALSLAPALALGGYLLFGTPLLPSMSAYYDSGMRDVFVGVLCAVGAFLFLY